MIHKGNHKKGTFSVISNLHLKDKRLSLKSKALLTQMLTLPPTWDYNLRGLATINYAGSHFSYFRACRMRKNVL